MIDQTILLEKLHYDQETGLFTWRVPGKRHDVGDIAGTYDEGYVRIGINNRRYRAHRLAWLYMTGEWPKHQIDHINGLRGDNRFRNLREATNAQNMRNVGVARTNSSGRKGVSWNRAKSKWHAQITVDGQRRHIGYFTDLDQAAAAYDAAAFEAHGGFARSNKCLLRQNTRT